MPSMIENAMTNENPQPHPETKAYEDLEQHQYCYLTTTGRATKQPHRIEIWFVTIDGTIFILSGGKTCSDWVKNLTRDPNVTVEIGSQRWHAVATIVDPSERHPARGRLADRYQQRRSGEPLSAWAADSLLVSISRGDDG